MRYNTALARFGDNPELTTGLVGASTALVIPTLQPLIGLNVHSWYIQKR